MTTTEFIKFDSVTKQFMCSGEWNLPHIPVLKKQLATLFLPAANDLTINGKNILKMDSAGALILIEWLKKLNKKGTKVHLNDFSPQQAKLIPIIENITAKQTALPVAQKPSMVTELGEWAATQFNEMKDFLNFTGVLAFDALRVARHPSRWRLNSMSDVIDKMGFQAMPIIALLSFMIGIVIAYQMGLQLRNYGANVFIVDLLGLSVLREFGPLLTAIMLAGRTGAAFTAQLGTMKINEEIDALNTMGVTPAELLLLPRILGLIIAMPLLTIWADFFGVFGGMIMANNMLNITWADFLHRFQHEIPVRALLIGLGKAPIFALIIASIGCFEGMKVQGSADSIGKNTTRSVVLAIFFIIVADSILSVIFSKLRL